MKLPVHPEIVAILPYNCVAPLGESNMGFIKHGDGKIVDVLDENSLTDEQKKSVAKKVSKQLVKQTDESTDSSQKKSGS